jgi:hypothetical protein
MTSTFSDLVLDPSAQSKKRRRDANEYNYNRHTQHSSDDEEKEEEDDPVKPVKRKSKLRLPRKFRKKGIEWGEILQEIYNTTKKNVEKEKKVMRIPFTTNAEMHFNPNLQGIGTKVDGDRIIEKMKIMLDNFG